MLPMLPFTLLACGAGAVLLRCERDTFVALPRTEGSNMSSSSAGARRRDTTLPPHVDEALVAYSALTGRSLSSAMALAVERGIVALAADLVTAKAATDTMRGSS